MNSLLSLPRTALGAIAVLAVLTLLGWGMVAYSSSQHDEAEARWAKERTHLEGALERDHPVAAPA